MIYLVDIYFMFLVEKHYRIGEKDSRLCDSSIQF